jgi:hypothetical protein
MLATVFLFESVDHVLSQDLQLGILQAHRPAHLLT